MSDALTRPRGGRPRVAERGTVLTTYVKASDYDLIVRFALKRGMSVSEAVRVVLERRIAVVERHPEIFDKA